jgi:hypothetical protein
MMRPEQINANFKTPANVVENAMALSFQLNPLLVTSLPSQAAAEPEPKAAPAVQSSAGTFSTVANSDGTKVETANGGQGEKSAVAAGQNNDSDTGTGMTSGTAFGDSMVGMPEPEPAGPVNILAQFAPKVVENANADASSLFGGKAGGKKVSKVKTLQEQTNEKFELFFKGGV